MQEPDSLDEIDSGGDDSEDSPEMVIELVSAAEESVAHRAPKKRRGSPDDCKLDGIMHNPPPDSTRKTRSERRSTVELPKDRKKQNSPGAPEKPYAMLSPAYQETYVIIAIRLTP